MRRGAKYPKPNIEAKAVAPRKLVKGEDSRVRDLEKRLDEALKREAKARQRETETLEQQNATSEILNVISRWPTDLQPVLDAVAQSASRLCGAANISLYRVEGRLMRKVAEHGRPLTTLRVGETRPITRSSVSGRAIIDRTTIHVPEVQSVAAAREYPDARRDTGIRTTIGIPLLRDDAAIGAFTAYRTESRSFSDREIALLQTFATQAVIAIENVRLFNETKEALEQQTATAEILRAIAASPTEIQPVLDTIARNAARVCNALDASLVLIAGDTMRIVARFGPLTTPIGLEIPLDRRSMPGRAAIDRQTLAAEDTRELPETEYPLTREFSRRFGHRSAVATPLLRQGAAIGALFVRRAEVRAFTDTQIALLETFADQAVIAIENVRLFTELQARNHDLTQALDQQTATSEILRVISSSPGDIQPVFDAIAANAARLCDAVNGLVIRFDGELLHLAAHYNVDPERLAAVRDAYPRPPSRGALSGRAILTRDVVHVPDVSEDAEYTLPAATTIGYRSVLAVPMMHEGVPRGTILVARDVVAPFSDAHIALIQTFADQAVIAIENARLFKELEARTHDLTRSVGELRALGEVGQAISSTLDLQTVLGTIVARATQLSGTDAGVIYEYDEQREVFLPRATEHLEAEIVETMLATPVRKGEGATGRLAEVQEPIQLPDILAAPAESRVRGALVDAGYRALLAVPLVREGHLLGGLTVMRRVTGEFAPQVTDLMRTFATQSALAIQNARLFREIEDKSRQLEVASQHKSEFLANMSHELRTPLNAIIGFSEVLSERMFGELNDKQEEYLKDIHASGQHLLSLINDILDLSKIEAGRMELEVKDFDLPQAIGNAVTLVRERAGRRGIALHQAVDQRLGHIQGDERKIKQVLLNLLSNALKFTPEGGRVEVRAGVADGMAEVSVTDTGVGIAPEDAEAVFEEFRQVGAADKKTEGTGLGLALSRKFIELHGGRIWVKSDVGLGSTFTFTLPLMSDDPRQAGVTA